MPNHTKSYKNNEGHAVHINEIHPELRKAFKYIPALPLGNRVFLSFLRGLGRLILTPRARDGVMVSEQVLGPASVRIYRPTTPSAAALLWIHGGGMILGHAKHDDVVCAHTAAKLNINVFSVEYRLAPEHPYPAAIDDCFNVWQWLQQNAAELGIDPARIAIGGESAGGGLAASLAQRVLDQGGVQPAAQLLVYPMLDDRTAARRELDATRHRLWSNNNNRTGWEHYLDQPAGAEQLPPYAAAARRDDLRGLPKAWLGVGEADLLYQEDCSYERRLRDAGVDCQFEGVPKAPHGFDRLVPRASMSRAFLESKHRFLRETLQLAD